MNLAEQALQHIKQGQRYQAAEAIDNLLRDNALLGDKWGAMARLALSIGEVGLAKEAATRYCNVANNSNARVQQRAALLAELGQLNESLELLNTITSKEVQYLHLKGTVLSQLGHLAQARDCFEQVIKAGNAPGQTWLSYCAIHKFQSEQDPVLAKLLEQQRPAHSNDIDKASYFYALGKAYEELNQHELALSHFEQGADLMAQQLNYNAEMDKKYVAATINSFSQSSLDELAQSNLTVPSPIFILGWPRTGTTLVEHILASHPNVIDGGEIDIMKKATMELKGSGCQFAKQFQDKFEQPEHAWEHLASTYLYLCKQRFGQTGQYIDKSLNNSRFVGLISKMFPKSPIIWVRRDPADAAWSCFKTFFSSPMPWSWSLTDIAAYFKAEDALYEHWSKLFPDQILTINYEDLVEQAETTTAQILKHCNLASQNLSDTFYQTSRAVTTASSVQVRQPIYPSSVNAAKHYSEFLQAFQQAYAQ